MWMPAEWMRRPILLLDSGRNVAESWFLDAWRAYLLQVFHDKKPAELRGKRKNRPVNIYVLYPDPSQWDRHTEHPSCWPKRDEWEKRSFRLHYPPDKQGAFHTAVWREANYSWNHRIPPWRRFHRKEVKRRRACAVYLNPSEQDLKWASTHTEKWNNRANIAQVHIGLSRSYWPANAHSWVYRVWAMTDEAKAWGDRTWNFEDRQYTWRCPWETFLVLAPNDKPANLCPTATRMVLAPNWQSPDCDRRGQELIPWAARAGQYLAPPERDKTAKDITKALTGGGYYVVASWREDCFPFDAAIAIANGMTIIAPDVPAFRRLPGRKLLWPARTAQAGRHREQILWNPQEIGPWLKATLERENARTRTG